MLPAKADLVLSDDDAPVEGQMKPHTKPMAGYSPHEARQESVHANASAASVLRKGEGDVVVGVGVGPAQAAGAPEALEKSRVWNQGERKSVV